MSGNNSYNIGPPSVVTTFASTPAMSTVTEDNNNNNNENENEKSVGVGVERGIHHNSMEHDQHGMEVCGDDLSSGISDSNHTHMSILSRETISPSRIPRNPVPHTPQPDGIETIDPDKTPRLTGAMPMPSKLPPPIHIPSSIPHENDNVNVHVNMNVNVNEEQKQHSPPSQPQPQPQPPHPNRRIKLGICAMDKKARSKPMCEILSRLDERSFHIFIFGNRAILEEPVEDWPIVDVLIAFYSTGFPLRKAQAYAELRRPYLVNDLAMQWVLMDRRRVYDLLQEIGVDVPPHVYMSRDGYVSKGIGSRKSCTNHIVGAAASATAEYEDWEQSQSQSQTEEEKQQQQQPPQHQEDELIEFDDHIVINDVVIQKPFVEKPIDAEDHNIIIYYPTSAGGGCKKLFRKVGDRSSEFYPDVNNVRREGSFIYEEFLETQGTDVKMYTVGPDYGHAEARKSPTVDGKVERHSDGKECRYPIILTLREKEIARRIVVKFKQQVCGFDLLRVVHTSENCGFSAADSIHSYVCDVNGWSFVKKSKKYYDDCAQILTEHMLAAVQHEAFSGCFSALNPLKEKRPSMSLSTVENRLEAGDSSFNNDGDDNYEQLSPINGTPGMPHPHHHHHHHHHLNTPSRNRATDLQEGACRIRDLPDSLMSPNRNEEDDRYSNSSVSTTHEEELRCVIAVIRHGDRTPKQKLKVVVSEPQLLQFYHKHCKSCVKDLKVKEKSAMCEFLWTVKQILQEHNNNKRRLDRSLDPDLCQKLMHMRDVLERWKIGGLNRKLQMKPRKWRYLDEDGSLPSSPKKNIDNNGDGNGNGKDNNLQGKVECSELLLILKWGGNLTKLGEKQAIQLGQTLRHAMYPDHHQGGILRLHSTFRHDLKIKTSDEGRVMKTAAAFAKGMLELEGEIPPILVSLVHKEKDSAHMLDPSGNGEVKKELEKCKANISKNLQRDVNVTTLSVDEREEMVGPTQLRACHRALSAIGNPRRALHEIHGILGELVCQLEAMLEQKGHHDNNDEEDDDGEDALSGIQLYKGETLLELTERWRFLLDRLYVCNEENKNNTNNSNDDDDDDDSEEEDNNDKNCNNGTFDLSRIPDVHDNARFDLLHNGHYLGLRELFQKLYNRAKLMADCVVPQEYGTAIDEKRSIGNKMCRALLEKVKHDLMIARTDNHVDMRYMVNMDYSNDCFDFSSLGRRIRTRLYFTSESHLHTLLNVMRFPCMDPDQGPVQPSILSRHGDDIISDVPELCYLTQIIFRLFEDPRTHRFRVEIMFSPGAAAEPFVPNKIPVIDSINRNHNYGHHNLDTVPLQRISKDNLSCAELEDFFSVCIDQGVTLDDEEMSYSTIEERRQDVLQMVSSTPSTNLEAAAADITTESDHLNSPFTINVQN